MPRITISGESKKDADGRTIRPEMITPNRRKKATDHGQMNMDGGTARGDAGHLSLGQFIDKRQREADAGDEYTAEKALESSRPSSDAGIIKILSAGSTNQESDLKAIMDPIVGIKKNAPVSSLINRGIEQSVLANIGKIADAAQDWFDDLASGEKSAKDHFRKHWMTPETMKEMEKSNAKMLAEHIDFQQYRVFKRGHEYQQMMMLSKAQRIYAMAGRRAGKTEGLILLAANEVIQPDHRVLIVGLTHETVTALYWHGILKLLDELDLPIAEKKQADGVIRLSNGSLIKFTGNSTSDEREKLRGGKWHLVIVDEAQSQKALPYLVRDIIEPMLLDYKGRLFLGGTGPRVRGTFWENIWENDPGAQKLNWNLTHNPFIPDHDTVLAKIRADKGLTEHDPLYLREYMGKIAYDDDALVLRFKEENYYEPEDFVRWVNAQPRSDIRFVGGLDYGYSDSDAFVILCYSESKPEIFVVYQYKASREGLETLKRGIEDGIEFIKTDPMFNSIPQSVMEDIYIFADSSDGRASHDLSLSTGLNIYSAMKHDKQAGVDMAQDDVRRNLLKIPKVKDGMSPLEDEGLKTVFLRDDNDRLTRELDDDTYHADMLPAVIYAARSGPWPYRPRS